MGSTRENDFNPDPTKQVLEIILSHKTTMRNHAGLMFNNNEVNANSLAFRYDVLFKVKLWRTFKVRVEKTIKTIGLLPEFQGILPRTCLVTIYIPFSRHYLDYDDILYDETFNELFHQRIESIQYNAATAVTGTIRGTSSEKLCQELRLESLRFRGWVKKL